MLGLKHDIDEMNARFAMISGSVESSVCKKCDTFVVALSGDQPPKVLGYRILEGPGEFETAVFANTAAVFAFHDTNHDFTYQPGEPHATYTFAESLRPGGEKQAFKLKIESKALPPRAGTYPVENLFAVGDAVAGEVQLQLGTLARLEDSRFSLETATTGMWSPLQFVKSGYAGIYFLGPYDPKKIPVLFVHGINGSPIEFSTMLAALDRDRFQPWVLYYPSGLEVSSLGYRLQGMLSKLHHQYQFGTMHIVAHSMGGLLVRSFLNDCRQSGGCSYVRTFISLSSPYGGDWAAQGGVDRSPVVMPVWRSMSQQGHFIRDLFATPRPDHVEHHLIFGFLNVGLFTSKSGDGVIPHDSQLRAEAQQQATSVRGFNATHGGILLDAEAIAYVNKLLAAKAMR